MWKRLRRMRGKETYLHSAMQNCEKRGIPLTTALRSLLCNGSVETDIRAAAAQLLSLYDPLLPAAVLMPRFFEDDGTDLVEISKIIRSTRDTHAIPGLIKALDSPNRKRREAAAYALGFRNVGTRAIGALIRVLADSSQSPAVRGQAAYSLQGVPQAAGPLISVLFDNAVEVRFWATWALSGTRSGSARREVVSALEGLLSDKAICPGYWSVAREALATLGTMDPPESDFRSQLNDETERVASDPEASVEDRRWANFWGD
jgi:HEAT repeat protein